MVNVRRIIVVLGAALAITGCLFPSMDDLSGASPPVGGEVDPVVPKIGSDGSTPDSASSKETPPGNQQTTDAGTSSSTPDSAAPPVKQMFACDNTSCEFGKQMCCTPDNLTGPWKCLAIAPRPSECGAVPQCTDNTDCKGAGESCCYNSDTRIGVCKTGSCSQMNEYILCVKGKNSCRNGKSCNGVWFGMDYCI